MIVKQTIIGPVDGWKYVIEDRTISCFGMTEHEFCVRKIGVFEFARNPARFLGFFQTLDQAKQAVDRSRRRSLSAQRQWL